MALSGVYEDLHLTEIKRSTSPPEDIKDVFREFSWRYGPVLQSRRTAPGRGADTSRRMRCTQGNIGGVRGIHLPGTLYLTVLAEFGCFFWLFSGFLGRKVGVARWSFISYFTQSGTETPAGTKRPFPGSSHGRPAMFVDPGKGLFDRLVRGSKATLLGSFLSFLQEEIGAVSVRFELY